jgi:hypothetical protein
MHALSKLLLLLTTLSACGTGAHERTDSAVSVSQIRTLIGQASCTDNAQCQTLGVGVKACGGPEVYLAWSLTHTDASALNALNQRYRQLRQEQISKSGEISNCMTIKDPGAYCKIAPGAVTGACQLRKDSAGSAD